MSETSKPKKRTRRRWIRWVRRLAIVSVLGIIGVLVYLNQIGLPNFAKSLLQAELQANGLNLEFERLRWRWEKGLVAENVRLQVTRTNAQPRLVAEDLMIRLDRQSLLTGTPKVSSVLLSNGALALPLAETAQAGEPSFRLEGLQTKLSFPHPNQWLLENFQAECLGVRLQLQAELTNAYALKDWQFKRRPSGEPPAWPKILRRVMEIREQLAIDGTPEVFLKIYGDAAHPEKSTTSVSLSCEGMESPWGTIDTFSLQVTAQEQPALQTGQFASSWSIGIGHLTQNQKVLQNLLLSANLVHDSQSGSVRSATWTLNSGAIEVNSTHCDSLQILGNTQPAPNEPKQFLSTMEVVTGNTLREESTLDRLRLSTILQHKGWDWKTAQGDWTASLESLQTPWAQLEQLTLDGNLQPNRSAATLAPESLGPWAPIRDYTISLHCRADDIQGDKIEAERFDLAFAWDAPNLALKQIQAELYDGTLDFTGKLAVDTRKVDLQGAFDFDVHRIMHLLTYKGKRWLRQYTFEVPPDVNVKASVVLPEWDDPEPDWRNEVKPTMSLHGNFNVGKAAFRTVPVEAASSSISFTNMTWRLPDLHVQRPEGTLNLDYRCNARTQDYHWKIDTLVDFHALDPLLSSGQRKGLSYFHFGEPVRTRGDVWGRWYAPELTRLKTSIQTENFHFRDEPIESLDAEIAFVNGLVTAKNVSITRSEGALTADLAQFNNHNGLITLTNAVSSVDTAKLAKLIGPSIERSFKSYRFAKPPMIHVNGVIPVDDMTEADARFQLKGGPFSFWKFNVPDITATVDWIDRDVTIHSVNAPFYGGSLAGEMALQLGPNKGAGFKMDATVGDADLNSLFRDVFSPTNQSQGRISGSLVIDSGQTDDWDSWQGSGNVRLKEGLLWDTPLFGIFSPVLNTLSPGLGNSRAETGQATFRITDSIIHTANLMIQEPTTRLQYQGKLDFQGNLDARVEAELLRDTPMLGRVMSMALWPVSKLFVYKVSGDLKEPIAEPVYVLPKFLLNPIDSLRPNGNGN